MSDGTGIPRKRSVLGLCAYPKNTIPVRLPGLNLRVPEKHLNKQRLSLLAIVLLIAASGVYLFNPAPPQNSLRVAVAANFRPAFEQLRVAFTRRHQVPIESVYGSTGMLYAQIQNGAPYDVFLAADTTRPRLIQSARKKSHHDTRRFTYALGKLVLWAPKANSPNPQWLEQQTGKIAMANPELAPYGAAAQQCLVNLKLHQTVENRTVLGTSVSQVFHFTSSGAAQAGFVALSQVQEYGADKGTQWIVPASCYDAIEQQVINIVSEKSKPEVAQFMSFMVSSQAQRIISASGYGLPQPLALSSNQSHD